MTSSDLWKPYRDISKMFFPNAIHAIDPFHLKMEMSRCVRDVRMRAVRANKTKSLSDKKKKELTPSELEEYETKHKNYILLTKWLWMFYKRPEDKCFNPNNKKYYNRTFKRYLNYYEIYNMILDVDDDLAEALGFQDRLYALFKKNDVKEAAKYLKKLITDLNDSDISEMRHFAGTLSTWKKEILNYFTPVYTGPEYSFDEDQYSHAESALIKKFIANTKKKYTKRMGSNLIENRNQVIKNIKQCSYGYSNWSRFRNRILFVCKKDSTAFLEPKKIRNDRKKEEGDDSD